MTRYRDMTEEQKAKRNERMRKRRADNREKYNERKRKWIAKNPEKYRERMRKYYAEHKEERRVGQQKRYAEHKEEINLRQRRRYAEHREERIERSRKWIIEHREKYNEQMRKILSEDLNRLGVRKSHIRTRSRLFLLSKHSKLEGYEIHHAFGYDDYTKFIYIPKTLHLQIHQLLRDNNIPADSDHWMVIRDIVNSCEQYTYISV